MVESKRQACSKSAFVSYTKEGDDGVNTYFLYYGVKVQLDPSRSCWSLIP